MISINVLKLKGKIVEAGYNNETFADALSMDASTFYRKIKTQGLSFTIEQMLKMVDVLKLSRDDARDIFLNQKSQ